MDMKSKVVAEPDIYMSAQTNLESAQYNCRLPAEKVSQFCHWFIAAAQNPQTFNAQSLATEKKAIKNELSKPGNAFNDMLPTLGWAEGVAEDWPAFDALTVTDVALAFKQHYLSHRIHVEIAGNLTACQLDEVFVTLAYMDEALYAERHDVAHGMNLDHAPAKLIFNAEKNLVGYFCEVNTASQNTYLTMVCAHQLLHAASSLSLYHKLRFDKGYIYNLVRAYHLFQGRGQYALFAQVQPDTAEKVRDEMAAFFSGDGTQLLDSYLPWATKKSLSAQMIAMEPLSEITKRASQHYVNFASSMDENEFYHYLAGENLETVFTDIQTNYFNKSIEVINHDRG